MSPDGRERVEHLCLEALSKDGAERTAFLDQACGDDVALRREVESLLAGRSEAGTFLESPPWAASAERLSPGTRLSPDHLRSLLEELAGSAVLSTSLPHSAVEQGLA